eukprot:4204032-Prymnesium_polylepis.1
MCAYNVVGCTDSGAFNYLSAATADATTDGAPTNDVTNADATDGGGGDGDDGGGGVCIFPR